MLGNDVFKVSTLLGSMGVSLDDMRGVAVFSGENRTALRKKSNPLTGFCKTPRTKATRGVPKRFETRGLCAEVASLLSFPSRSGTTRTCAHSEL